MTLMSSICLYLTGVILVWLCVLIGLRREPTAHGQIVGRQVGCALAFLWPIGVPYFCLVGLCLGVTALYRRVRR